jgi:undecaprenyl-diphosphatase
LGPQPLSLDRAVEEYWRLYRNRSPVLTSLLVVVTALGALVWMVIFVLLVALLLWGRRQRRLALVWVLAIAGGALLNNQVKELYTRPRPMEPEAHVHETSFSFPSGHSMASLIGYGLLSYLLALILPRRWWGCYGAFTALALLVAAIGFSRVYLGAHWLTDVLAGFAMGGAWLVGGITAIEAGRRHRISSQEKPQPLAASPGR